jgi:predicted nuclease of restriction endonuclease-like (RecB) superfamily
MSKKKPPSTNLLKPAVDYSGLLADVVKILEAARRASARAVNSVMTATYWEIGRRIVEFEQGGEQRAMYGTQLIEQLAADLKSTFGRGFSPMNLRQMRRFYSLWPLEQIQQTLSVKSGSGPDQGSTVAYFRLPWSHYVKLLSVDDEGARRFYEQEALRGGWSVRQLDRQIGSQFYQRTMLSKNKATMLRKGAEPQPSDLVTAEEEIKDPFVLEFLDLKDEYSEHDLEASLIDKLEEFLLELGTDFAFIGRQKRLRIGDEWYRIDLLFFHRLLRCLIVIDLKIGKFTHADAGQMHLYLNYAREHWTHAGENPPVGLILCAQKDEAVAHYSLDNLPNKVMASEYRLALPDEKFLAAQLEKSQRALEQRGLVKSDKEKATTKRTASKIPKPRQRRKNRE